MTFCGMAGAKAGYPGAAVVATDGEEQEETMRYARKKAKKPTAKVRRR